MHGQQNIKKKPLNGKHRCKILTKDR